MASFLRNAARIVTIGRVVIPHANVWRKSAPVSTIFLPYLREKSTAPDLNSVLQSTPGIVSAVPACHQTAKVIFENHKTADFKYIWLRDNCKCPSCIHPDTRQKLLDSPSISTNIKPKSVVINDQGQLQIVWEEGTDLHTSKFDASWLYRYGQCFIHDTFDSPGGVPEDHPERPPIVTWDRTVIWKHLPELSYNEFMSSTEGLRAYLQMFHQYGLAILRGVPTKLNQIREVVNRFAYIKETQYGVFFDVKNDPDPEKHLAFSGNYLDHHTDMNYREKSPGMQLLHCLQAEDPSKLGRDPGGHSFFVDGLRIAKWLEENEPTAFHILSSTPMRFSIKNEGRRYSQLWPVICLNPDGDVTEVHINNRTMGPLQVPSHLVMPFYHAYKLFTERVRDPNSNFTFHLTPGDLVAFNNRRVLHGRAAFNPHIVNRHLQGCYVDVDEAMSKYDSLLA